MTTMQKIIDKLASKELSFGCRVKAASHLDWHKGEQIIIGGAIQRNEASVCYEHSMNAGSSSVSIEKSELKILGHPVYIGNVLERVEVLRQSEPFENTAMRWVNKIIVPWSKCGLSKSLQEIEECGYEEVNMCGACGGTGVIYQEGYKTMCAHCQLAGMGFVQRLKDPNAQALADFINSII